MVAVLSKNFYIMFSIPLVFEWTLHFYLEIVFFVSLFCGYKVAISLLLTCLAIHDATFYQQKLALVMLLRKRENCKIGYVPSNHKIGSFTFWRQI